MSQNTLSTSLYSRASSSLEVNHDDDEGVLLTADVYERTVAVTDKVTCVLQVIGLALNIINIIVMTRRRMRSPTTTFLVALSVLQLVYITVRLLRIVRRIFKLWRHAGAFFVMYTIYFDAYGLTCLRRSMYCIQCCVSVERLLAVWMPLKAKQFLLVRRPWLFIVIIPVVVFLTHINITLKLEVYGTTTPQNGTAYEFRYTELYHRHPEIFHSLGIVWRTIFVYLTLMMLITTNLAVTGVIKRYASMRRQMKTSVDVDATQKRETQMTLTILVSTLIFVVLCLPTVTYAMVADFAPQIYGSYTVNRYLFFFMLEVGGLFFTLAFSTDVFTYVALSSAYRKTLLRLLTKRSGSNGFCEN